MKSPIRRLLGICCVFLASACAHESGPAAPATWPTGGWRHSSPAEQGIDGDRLEALHQTVEKGGFGNIDSILVIRNGFIVFEKSYPRDYAQLNGRQVTASGLYDYYDPVWHPFYRDTSLHSLQSITKSVTSALIGLAIARGEVAGVDAKLIDFLREADADRFDERKKSITIEDVLTMRVGMEWDESSVNYTDPRNSCARMEMSEDWLRFVLERPMIADPGTRYEYNSGATILLSHIIRQATGRYADDYAREHLFKPLGIEDFYWKRTPTELPDTEGGLYLTPHDLAKVGYLYLKDGVWEGRRILPEGWVSDSTRRHTQDTAPENDRWNAGYGYQWWAVPFEGAAGDVPTGLGYGGQYLLVSAEQNMIAVVNAWNIEGGNRLSVTEFGNAVFDGLR